MIRGLTNYRSYEYGLKAKRTGTRFAAGAAERGIFTFFKEQDVFHFQGRPLLNVLFGVEKEERIVWTAVSQSCA